MNEDRIAELEKRLKASEGQPGFEGRNQMIRAELDQLRGAPKPKRKPARHRSAGDGKFVTRKAADKNPAGTVKEKR